MSIFEKFCFAGQIPVHLHNHCLYRYNALALLGYTRSSELRKEVSNYLVFMTSVSLCDPCDLVSMTNLSS